LEKRSRRIGLRKKLNLDEGSDKQSLLFCI
jgi:hypothetical protein